MKKALAVLLVLVMLGSVITPAMANTEVTRTHVKLILREKSRTSTVVEVNNVLISLKSNKNLTKANLEIKDLKTGKTYIFEYRVSENNGKYTIEVYSKGRLVNKYESKYNPLDSNVTKKLLSENSKRVANIRILSYSYWWDGVKFVKGYGVKYPHPDYAYYRIEPWDDSYITGNKLVHYHISDYNSQKIAGLPPVVAGAVIGGIVGEVLGGGVGGVVGGIVGGVLALWFGADLSNMLLDEHGSIWFWFSKSFSWVTVPVAPYVAWVPNYFRVASYTLWDALGIGNP